MDKEDFPPPFAPTKRESQKIPGEQISPVPIGAADLTPPSTLYPRNPLSTEGVEEGGMLMGPHHSAFKSPQRGYAPAEAFVGVLPSGAIPPGARFDPITPEQGFEGSFPSGDPDPDELPPPGHIGKPFKPSSSNPFQPSNQPAQFNPFKKL